MIQDISAPFYFLLIGLFFLLLLIPFRLRIEIHNLRDNNVIHFTLMLLVFNRLQLLTIKKNFHWFNIFEGKKILGTWNNIFRTKKDPEKFFIGMKDYFSSCLQQFLKHMPCTSFVMTIKIGTGDPAWTGILTSILRVSSSLLVSKFAPASHQVVRTSIFPSFYHRELSLYLFLEVKLSGLKVILFALAWSKLFLLLINQRYRRNKKCQTDPSKA